jgi:repressor LexA
MSDLTSRQEQVLNFIEEYQLDHGKSPTIREIKEFLDVSSDNSVLKHLKALEKKGFIEKDDTPRGIKLLESIKQKLSADTFSIPVLGYIPAGGPVGAEEHVEDHITLDTSQIKNPSACFILRVTGQSMIDAGIYEGDMLIVDSSKTAKVGDIVIALVDNENTVKRLIKDSNGNYLLKAENPDYSDIIPVEDLQIQGVVLSLQRKYY